MNREEIIEKVTTALSEEFDVAPEVIIPDAIIYDTLQLDSLSAVEMLSVLQYTFGVKIPVADLPGIKTFDSLYDYIEERQR